MSEKILCVDIGGSKILTGITDGEGSVLFRQKRLFCHPDREQVVEAILEESAAALEQSCWKDRPDEEISAVGVSIPGLADSEKGLWVYAPFSGIENLDVRTLLGERLRKPVFLDNDGNVCAIGEKRFGLAKDVDDFLWVTVSNGVGAGLMLNGRLYNGASRGAGELGHVRVEDGGLRCPCGKNGCLEAYAAGPGIVRRYQERTGKEKAISALEIAQLARNGDGDAKAVFEREGFYLGKAIASAVNILNLPLVVLGGGVSGSYDLFQNGLKQALQEYLFLAANRELKVLPTALGYEASLIGAGALALNGLESNSLHGDY